MSGLSSQGLLDLVSHETPRATLHKLLPARKKCAAGKVGEPVHVPRSRSKRPGGKEATLTDTAVAKRRLVVQGRRGAQHATRS